MTDGWIEFTGLTFTNLRVNEDYLPTREITDTMLYHMFASGLFEKITVKRAYDTTYTDYNRSQMQNYVQEKDRREIRKLQAELAEERKRKGDVR